MFNVCCETCCRSLSSRSGWTWPWSRKTCFEQAPCCAEACNVTCVPVSDRSSLGLECVLASRALARPWLSLTSQTCEASYKNAVGYWLLLTVLAIACSACCCFHLLSPSPAMEIVEDSLLQHRSFNPKDVVAREPSSWRDLVPADFLMMESPGAGGSGGGAWVLLRSLHWYLYLPEPHIKKK